MTKKQISYRDSLEEVEQIIEEMETGTIDIDQLTDKISRALLLLSDCKKKLKKSEDEIRNLLQKIEKEE